MNPGPGVVEEVGKVAAGIIEALKNQPATIAMIVVAFGLLGYTFYQSHYFNVSRQDMLEKFLDSQREVNRLLSQCIVPKQGG